MTRHIRLRSFTLILSIPLRIHQWNSLSKAWEIQTLSIPFWIHPQVWYEVVGMPFFLAFNSFLDSSGIIIFGELVSFLNFQFLFGFIHHFVYDDGWYYYYFQFLFGFISL
ncbi:hypothetical protein YN1HA_18220 [Sulfurisphaera ohwakuensis]